MCKQTCETKYSILNYFRPTDPVTDDDVNWLSIVPSHRYDVCDVILPLTTPPLYVTRRHNNVNPPRSVTSFMDDPIPGASVPLGHIT